MVRAIATAGALAVLGAASLSPALGQSPTDFYKSKQIAVVIGSDAGGGYDAYGRLVARHLGKHIAGNPTIIPQNMPGAGQTKAAGYVYSVAPKDGTAIAEIGRAHV